MSVELADEDSSYARLQPTPDTFGNFEVLDCNTGQIGHHDLLGAKSNRRAQELAELDQRGGVDQAGPHRPTRFTVIDTLHT